MRNLLIAVLSFVSPVMSFAQDQSLSNDSAAVQFEVLDIPDEAPNEWTLVGKDNIKIYYRIKEEDKNWEQTVLMETYKDSDGVLRSLVKMDDNSLIWFYPEMTTDIITGAKKYSPNVSDNIIGFKRDFGNFNLAYDKEDHVIQLISKNPDCYELRFPLSVGAYNLWNGSNFSIGYFLGLFSDMIKKAETECMGKSLDEAKSKLGDWIAKNSEIRLTFPSGEKIELSPVRYDLFYWTADLAETVFGKRNSYRVNGDELYHLFFVEEFNSIPLSLSDKISSVDVEDNIMTLKFANDVGFIWYSLYSHFIYGGVIFRPKGSFNLENDNPRLFSVKYTLHEPITVEHRNSDDAREILGTCEIPIGSNLTIGNSLVLTYRDPTEAIFHQGCCNEGWLHDVYGNATHFMQPGNYSNSTLIFWKKGKEIAAQKRAEEERLYKQKCNSILTKYKAKYGTTTVNNIMNGIIRVGMPWELIKQVFPNGFFNQSRYSTTYKVVNNIPKIDIEKGIITIQEYGLGKLCYITVRNGKVSDVSVTNLR